MRITSSIASADINRIIIIQSYKTIIIRTYCYIIISIIYNHKKKVEIE